MKPHSESEQQKNSYKNSEFRSSRKGFAFLLELFVGIVLSFFCFQLIGKWVEINTLLESDRKKILRIKNEILFQASYLERYHQPLGKTKFVRSYLIAEDLRIEIYAIEAYPGSDTIEIGIIKEKE